METSALSFRYFRFEGQPKMVTLLFGGATRGIEFTGGRKDSQRCTKFFGCTPGETLFITLLANSLTRQRKLQGRRGARAFSIAFRGPISIAQLVARHPRRARDSGFTTEAKRTLRTLGFL